MQVKFKLNMLIGHYTGDANNAIVSMKARQEAGEQHINFNQSMAVEDEFITVEGERHALWSDDYAPVMKALKDAVDQGYAVVVGYATSDQRLKWHETLVDYIDNRSTLSEYVAYYILYENTGKIGSAPSRFGDFAKAFNYLKRGGKEHALGAMVNSHHAQVAAKLFQTVSNPKPPPPPKKKCVAR